jgi:uncharacterized membrane protein
MNPKLVPASLIVLSLVPVVAGAVRLTELAGGTEITTDNARFFDMPVPVVIHIVGASIYCLLGAFQFVPSFRRRKPGWHRVAGRILVLCGLAAALSGLWMSVAYPQPPGDGPSLTGLRLVFGSAMAVSLVLAFTAIRRRNIVAHKAWMIRAYAIGQGAGTQFFTHLPWFLLVGKPTELPRTLLMAAGWLINIAVAEWIIRRKPVKRPALAHSQSLPV